MGNSSSITNFFSEKKVSENKQTQMKNIIEKISKSIIENMNDNIRELELENKILRKQLDFYKNLHFENSRENLDIEMDADII